MFTKTTGLLIIPTWLASMGWLIAHDVWPHLTAMEAPPLKISDWLQDEGRKSRYSISDEHRNVGTVWTEFFIGDRTSERHDLIWIDGLGVGPQPMRMRIKSTYTGEGKLDEFTLQLNSHMGMMRLHGERFRAHFSFELETGSLSRTMKVPLTEGDTITGAFNPFSQLSDLAVGQRWRMHVFNPVAAVLGIGDRFIPLLVEVTGEERIEIGERQINCLIVESTGAKAWVDARGAVQMQEARIPMLGMLRLTRQADFNVHERDMKNRHPFHESETEN